MSSKDLNANKMATFFGELYLILPLFNHHENSKLYMAYLIEIHDPSCFNREGLMFSKNGLSKSD